MNAPRRVFPWWMRFWAWLVTSRPTAFEGGRLFASRSPGEGDIRRLHARGVRLVVNLKTTPGSHHADLYRSLDIVELHLPVADLTAPTLVQLRAGVDAITEALARGDGVLVHCAAGLGRTGTLLAAYFVSKGMAADEALRQVRSRRPGSIETAAQEAVIEEFARSLRSPVARAD